MAVADQPPLRRPIPWAVRLPILALAGAPRVWAAVSDQGLFWPDEFYQSLEQAHRFAFGYGIVPWEFVEGARSWVYPGTIGLLWKALDAVGVHDARALILVAKLLMAALAVAGVEAVLRIAHAMAGLRGAALAGILVALHPALVFFATKCFSESASGPVIAIATALAFRRDAHRAGGRVRLALSGALASLAIYLRYQNGLLAVGLLAILLSERRRRDAVSFAGGAIVVGVAGGLLDAVIWGSPFHSFFAYLRFQLGNGAAAWGTAGFDYYLRYGWFSTGPAMMVVVLGLVFIAEHAWRLVALVGLYLLVHSLVPHKEYRYLTPVLPLVLALSGAGLVKAIDALRPQLAERFGARAGRAERVVAGIVVGLVCAGFAERMARMTFADLGHGDGLAAGLASGRDRPWHAAEGINRLLWAAGEADDVCGVVIQDIPWSSTGGYAYFHKDAPLLFEYTERNLASANYLIARRETPRRTGYRPGPESRGFVLLRRDGICAPPPEGFSRIEPP
ncbi:hypothetical protein [Pendulispora albinea]|uniref:Mannosyltransferase n=1 Tax=Pendulispora albinea TaxID=2741071 RepID=A0ABZ2M596_9BACT